MEVVVVLLSFAFLYWIYKSFLERKPDDIECGTGVFAFYYLLLSVLRNRKPIFSQNVYILQALCAYVAMFRGGMFKFSMLFRPAIYIYNHKAVETLLSSPTVIEKSKEYRLLHLWLGTGLLTSAGEKWRRRRKLLTPSFHFRILEDFMSVFNSKSDVLIEKLNNVVHQDSIDVVPFVTMCTLDIICESTMGVYIKAQEQPESEYVKSINDVSSLIFYRLVRPWLWIDQVFFLSPSGQQFKKRLEDLHTFTRQVIRSKKEEMLKRMKENNSKNVTNFGNDFEMGEKKRKAFLELLLELHLKDPSFSEEDIKEEVDTFMFEGHDTTAMAISWTLYNVGLRPDIQKKIHIEIDEIFGNNAKRPITSDDIKAMKYLDLVIKETLRLYPSVPLFGREVTEDIEIMGRIIPKGYMIGVFSYMLHRDPSVFPNPEYFDPDRFLPENCSGRNPFAYIPFSAGPRNCIGQKFALNEEKTVLANVFRNFEIRSLDPRDRIYLTSDLILRSDGPLKLKLTPRNQKMSTQVDTLN